MVLRRRIVSAPGAYSPPTESLVLLATSCTYLVAGVFLLLVLLMSPGEGATDPGVAPDRGPGVASAALAASVSETPDAVRVRIQASGDVEPGSVEVRFARRRAVVIARDAEGRAIRSQRLRLPAPVVEEEAGADYDTDGTLVVTLRKRATAQDAGLRNPEAAAR